MGARRSARVIAFLLVCALMAAMLPATARSAAREGEPPASPAAVNEASLRKQAAEWVRVLAKQPAFAEWRGASIAFGALGPGTHGWLAVLSQGGRTVGYLVIAADPAGGSRLVEYGTGPNTLFGLSVLKRAADRYGFDPGAAERRYEGPFLAVWRIPKKTGGPLYVDAKTGDAIAALSDAKWKTAAARRSESDKSSGAKRPPAKMITPAVESLLLVPEFDPFARLPWVKQPPLTVRDVRHDVLPLLRSGRELRMTASPYGSEYLAVWALAGALQWSDGRFDIAVRQDGLRFIDAQEAIRHALFYS